MFDHDSIGHSDIVSVGEGEGQAGQPHIDLGQVDSVVVGHGGAGHNCNQHKEGDN